MLKQRLIQLATRKQVDYPEEKLFLLDQHTECAIDNLDEYVREMFKQLIREIARAHGWPFKPNSFSAIELGPRDSTELLELILKSGNSVVGIGNYDYTNLPAPQSILENTLRVTDFHDFLSREPPQSRDIVYGRNSFLPAVYFKESHKGVPPEEIAHCYIGDVARVLKPLGRLILYFDEGLTSLLGYELSQQDTARLESAQKKKPDELDGIEFHLRFVTGCKKSMEAFGIKRLIQYQYPVLKRPSEEWLNESGKREVIWTKMNIKGVIEVYMKS